METRMNWKPQPWLRRYGVALGLCCALGNWALVARADEKQETVVLQHDFENANGILRWPAGGGAVLDTKHFHTGKSSLVFAPDNAYTAYWYFQVKPAHRYQIALWYRADKTVAERNGVSVNFNEAVKGNGSAGSHRLSFAEIKADSEWHQFEAVFDTPHNAAAVQFVLNFLDTTATVNIDDLKVSEQGNVPEKTVRVDISK
jgi:hypothetical protein